MKLVSRTTTSRQDARAQDAKQWPRRHERPQRDGDGLRRRQVQTVRALNVNVCVVYVGRCIRGSVDAEDHESMAQSSSMSRLLNLMHGLLTHACTTTLSFSTIQKMHQIGSDAAVLCRRLPVPVRPEADAPDPSGACCACAVYPSPMYCCKLLLVVGLTLVNLCSLSYRSTVATTYATSRSRNASSSSSPNVRLTSNQARHRTTSHPRSIAYAWLLINISYD